MPRIRVLDSSGWLEYVAEEPNAGFLAPAIEATAASGVPVIRLYEVFRRVYQQRGEDEALQAVAVIRQGQNVPLRQAQVTASIRLCLLRMRFGEALYKESKWYILNLRAFWPSRPLARDGVWVLHARWGLNDTIVRFPWQTQFLTTQAGSDQSDWQPQEA